MAQAVGLVVFDPEAESSLARWVAEDVMGKGMDASLRRCLCLPVPAPEGEVTQSQSFLATAQEAIVAYVHAHHTEARSFVFLVVAVFWDGQSEDSKSRFAELRQLTEDRAPQRKQLIADVSAACPAGADAEVLVQALNAKGGEHTMQSNRAALVNSLQKKLSSSQVIATHGAAPIPSTAPKQESSVGGGAADASTAATTGGAADLLNKDFSAAALDHAVEEGQGEAFFPVTGTTQEQLQERLAEIRKSCESIDVAVAPVMAEPREVKLKGSNGGGSGAPVMVFAQEFLLRRCREGRHLELRLAMCGNVDSGKSTLTSVLTRGGRDDGRGAARALVFNHKHEASTGRTSSISENHLGFSGTGEVVNYQFAAMRGGQQAHSATTGGDSADAASAQEGGVAAGSSEGAVAGPRQFTPQELASHSAKVFTLYDLAGHEKYLKTTVLGMTRNMPDYACIVISANNGIQRMTKEHLALCLALKLPFFIAVTRIDATPETVRKETLSSIHKLLRIPTVRKLPYPVTKPDELILAAKNLRMNAITPIFEISNVAGTGISDLLRFLNLLPMRKDWRAARQLPREMIIDSTFFVTGVGTVVGGIVTQGVFHVNDTVLLGPDGFGQYRPVSIKSIHVKGVDCTVVEAGNDAAFCLKKEKRSAIRKGNILADPLHPPLAYWQFEAEITILYHSTTITTDYEPVIHSTTVRQSARMTYVEKETLRTGDKSIVRFHFLYRPEFMHDGQRLIFREGRTKGIGVVTTLIKDADEQLLAKSKVRKALLKRAAHAPQQTSSGAPAAKRK